MIGLVLKPSHWGPSSGTFYLREPGGRVVPDAPREFAITPPERPKQEGRHQGDARPIGTDGPRAAEAVPPERAVSRGIAGSTQNPGLAACVFAARKKAGRDGGLSPGSDCAGGTVVVYPFAAPAELSLQAYAVAPGQLRISWNRNSRPVIDGISGMVEINDGGYDTRIPLSASQLKLSGITYTQKTEHVSINLRVDGRRAYAPPAQESIEFVGPLQTGPSAAADSPEQQALVSELRAELPIARATAGTHNELPVETAGQAIRARATFQAAFSAQECGRSHGVATASGTAVTSGHAPATGSFAGRVRRKPR